ncbi:MAG: hypothetical protein HY801_00405 [Candidatus Lindowbacteria bacterium]|nr:hypothetical protein [Candidatus Lindowbacteria bacterium]
MKKVVLFLSVAAMVCLLVSPAWADGSDPNELQALKDQLMELNKVVQGQQQQIQEQGQKLQQQEQKIQELEETAKEQAPYADVEAVVEKVKADLPKPADGLTLGGGKIRVTPYGFIRLDMAYDDSATSHGAGNVLAFVWPEDGSKPVVQRNDDSTFTTTATATRLGLNFEGPEFVGGNIKGKVEIDFDEAAGSDSGGDVTAHRIRMRHAYAELLYPTWSLMAGQNWDIVAPRIPNMLDCMVMWGSGNVGYRRPQVRVSKWWDVDGSKITGQLSLNHADRKAADDIDKDLILDGADSSWPMGEARLGVDTVILGERKLSLGLSGALGEEELDFPTNPGSKQHVDVWLIALDGSVTIIPNLLTLQGEIWTGEDLDAFMGGVFQGIAKETTEFTGIDSSGGFLAAALTPRKNLQFNFGYGIDDPDDDDGLSLDNSSRSQNYTLFGNAIWTVVPNFDVGLELAWHETKWEGQEDGDDFRIQSAVIYKF